jgi:hypothetical protein
VEFEPQRRRDWQIESFEYLLIASICIAFATSIRATGTPVWMIWITALTAASILTNEHTAAEIATGIP